MNSLLLCLFIGEAIVVFLFFFLSLKAFYDSEKVLLDNNCPLESEIKKYTHKKDHKVLKVLKTTFSSLFFGALIVATGICALAHYDKNAINYLGSSPVAILTGSMSKKNEKNTYLIEKDINTQFNAGSIILLDKMPEKENLRRYDVVGYWSQENVLIVHRIIDFGVVDENGNFTSTATTSEATHFIFRGDANASRDSYFVEYKQMYGIYRNYKIDNLGYVVSYFQSYFGLISIIGICSVVFAEDYYSRKTDKAYKEYIAKNIKLLPLKEEIKETSDVITEDVSSETIIDENPSLEDTPSTELEDTSTKEEISNEDISQNLESSEDSKIIEEEVDSSNNDDIDEIKLEEDESSNDLKEEEDETSKEEITSKDIENNLEESESSNIKEKEESKEKDDVSNSEFKKAKHEAFNDKEGKNYKAKKLEEKERKKREFLIKKEESQKKKDAKKTAHRLNR